MILYIIHKVPFFRNIYFCYAGKPFVRKKINPIIPFLPTDKKILDIGSGNGLVTFLLRQKGFDLTPLDIHDGSYDSSVIPIIYDGNKIPFPDKSFHTGIILTVLHHTETIDAIITEASRVCEYIIIMEDIYENKFQKYVTYFLDSLANLFYSPCPHTNRNDREWKKTFIQLNLTLEHVEYRNVIFIVKQGIYFLKSH